MGERIAGKQDGPGPIIDGPPRAPRIAKKCTFLYIVAHIWKPGSYVFPYICLLCDQGDEVLLPWNFRSPVFDIRAPQDPPKYEKKYILFKIWV